MSVDRIAHYEETIGNVPAPIRNMFAMSPEFADAYTDIRELIYTEREEGLSVAMKELILVLLDVVVGQTDGAINHLRAAQRGGLTQTQLMEGLLETFLVFGVSKWGLTGHKVWEASAHYEEHVPAA
jgi:alkylhydroperoxidase/carboxymuconolactone decarboxylase family protein YurZ